ncbi:MAG: leucyl/phenylalanyl-tRNA--protein transferase [Chlorobiaceae bacterium]|jgi:leucyl/phenylalanyl-tRNA---protein transferase|nr:leucyl/phenylalanyl-tRNA--protein transferase [Chlorobiaceae bacterium]NTV16231.1 leucyl/phenylalanyl-tRNA--protein transferase [Chlorobiaceae bacterium]
MIRIDDLLKAYRQGFFPMSDPKDEKVYWCQPYKRAVVYLDSYKPSRDVLRLNRKKEFSVTCNKEFVSVIKGCAAPRKNDPETWISGEIMEAYIKLHRLGFAHSIESWYQGELVGGLYGIAMGAAFFGESMFSRRSYASRIAFDHLVLHMKQRGYLLLDAQIMNPHLGKLGAVEIEHDEYMLLLAHALKKKIVFL